MTNILRRGATWLGTKLQTAAGRTVRIKRRGKLSAEITATVASKEYEVPDSDGIPQKILHFDWTFVTSEIVLETNAVDLRSGDWIIETLSGVEQIFEVLPIGKMPCVEWADTSGILTLVHTKRVARDA